jgi:predicted PurR-regulated permease PerM
MELSPASKSKVIAYGILRALLIIGGVVLLLWFLYAVQAVILYIGAAAVISLVGRPIVIFLRERLKMNNTLAVIITLFMMLLLACGILYMIVPVVVEQGNNLSRIDLEIVRANTELLNIEIRDYFGFKKLDLYEQVMQMNYVRNFDMEVITVMLNDFLAILGQILIGIFSTLFIAFFLLKDSRLLLEGVLVFSKQGNEGQFLRAFTKIKSLLSRYFVGLILQVLIIFVLYSVILLIVGVNNAIIIAFFCALLNLVPYLGPVLGFVLMQALVVSDNLGYEFQTVILPKLIIVAIGYTIVQLIDNFFNQPLIFGKSVKSHPLEIFIVILIAGLMFGVMGLVLAVPTYTAIKVISKEFLSEYKIVQKLTANL